MTALVITVAIACVGFYITLRNIRDQLWLQTFSEYTRRYSSIVVNLPSESRRVGGDFDLGSLDPDKRAEVLNAARAYLNLASEELFLHKRHRIDSETWEVWKLGIIDTVRLPWLSQAWKELEPEYTYYEDFCSFMTKCLGEDTQ